MQPPHIQRIVLTGGPCAGKSTALTKVGEWLRKHNVEVYLVPEASTLLLGGGITVAGGTVEAMRVFQRSIVQVQLALEAGFTSFAQTCNRRAVLLCDRGVLDGTAYLPREVWADVLIELGLNETDLLARYDAVIHLVSAAVGAESYYGLAGNNCRYESLEEARGVDQRLQEAWRSHGNHRVIDNANHFDAKIQRVVSVVSELVGVSQPGR